MSNPWFWLLFFLIALPIRFALAQEAAEKFSIEVDVKKCQEYSRKLAPFTTAQANEKTLQEISAKKPKVILLGEDHFTHYFWKLPHIFEFLQERLPQLNCLYTEISSDATDQEVAAVIAGKPTRAFTGQYRVGYGMIYEPLRARGVHIVPVDGKVQDMINGQKLGFMGWIAQRDDAMVENIVNSLKSGKCSGGVFNVGGRHIMDTDISGNAYKSMATKLREKLGKDLLVIDQAYLENMSEAHCSALPNNQALFTGFVARSREVPRGIFQGQDWDHAIDYVLFLHPWEGMNTLLYVPPTPVAAVPTNP